MLCDEPLFTPGDGAGWINLNDFAILFLFLALPLCRWENHANKYLFSPYTPETGDKAINKKHYNY